MAYLQDIVVNCENNQSIHVAVYATPLPRIIYAGDTANVVALTVVNCHNVILTLPTLLLQLTSLQYLYIRQNTSVVSSRLVNNCSEKVIDFVRTSTTYRTRLELLLDSDVGHRCIDILNNSGYPFCRNLQDVVLAVPHMDPVYTDQVLSWCDLSLKTLVLYPTGIPDTATI